MSTREIMTAPELAEYLRLGESTIYRLASQGKIPGRKIGGTWRFSKEAIDDWLRGLQGSADKSIGNEDG